MEPAFAIGAFGKVYELLGRLLNIGQVRRKALFDEFLKPSFEDLLEVHASYRLIFLRLLRGIDELGSMYAESTVAWREPDSSEMSMIDAARANKLRTFTLPALIGETRALQEESKLLRFRLYNNAEKLLTLFDRRAEQRYLFAVILYFVDEHPYPRREVEFEMLLDSFLSAPGTGYFDTPSERLAKQLESLGENRPELRRAAKYALESLDQRYIFVSSAFTELKFQIVSNASAAEQTIGKA